MDRSPVCRLPSRWHSDVANSHGLGLVMKAHKRKRPPIRRPALFIVGVANHAGDPRPQALTTIELASAGHPGYSRPAPGKQQAHAQEHRRQQEEQRCLSREHDDDRVWKSAQEITEDMLVTADKNWQKNRVHRSKPRDDQFSIRLDIWHDYLHRCIQIIIWRRRHGAEEAALANHHRIRRYRFMKEPSGGDCDHRRQGVKRRSFAGILGKIHGR
ncbi:hypothetical protein SAMN04487785_1189 [Dyella jiangningensis]|nr:hypothetical protein BDW41_11581 [Dyella sp. AtDHG13]SDL34110.1 hypothetical protein SAMN04487785_1189 [Dyella jiangningensis]